MKQESISKQRCSAARPRSVLSFPRSIRAVLTLQHSEPFGFTKQTPKKGKALGKELRCHILHQKEPPSTHHPPPNDKKGGENKREKEKKPNTAVKKAGEKKRNEQKVSSLRLRSAPD